MPDGEPRIVLVPLSPDERVALASDPFGDMFKFVVDIAREIVAVGGDFHADAESLLLEDGSRQADLWGANYHPGRAEGQRIEYTALINVYPARGNRGNEIQSPEVRAAVRRLAERWIGPA